MKLEKDKILFVGFMLFSMFFGAGNLIFPPFLGQNAGNQTLPSVIGFLITAVVLPVLAGRAGNAAGRTGLAGSDAFPDSFEYEASLISPL